MDRKLDWLVRRAVGEIGCGEAAYACGRQCYEVGNEVGKHGGAHVVVGEGGRCEVGKSTSRRVG